MKRLKLGTNSGFTLVELLVSLGVGMVVVAAVTTTFMSQAKIYTAQEQVNEMEQNARGALDIIAREVKMAGYKPAGGTVNGVTYSSSQLLIQADLDGSGAINTASTSNEQITYAYDSTNKQITRALGTGTAQVLADNIIEFTFEYLDAGGNATTTTADIRQIRISVTARTAKPDPNFPSDGGYRQYQVTTTVTPINLGL